MFCENYFLFVWVNLSGSWFKCPEVWFGQRDRLIKVVISLVLWTSKHMDLLVFVHISFILFYYYKLQVFITCAFKPSLVTVVLNLFILLKLKKKSSPWHQTPKYLYFLFHVFYIFILFIFNLAVYESMSQSPHMGREGPWLGTPVLECFKYCACVFFMFKLLQRRDIYQFFMVFENSKICFFDV